MAPQLRRRKRTKYVVSPDLEDEDELFDPVVRRRNETASRRPSTDPSQPAFLDDFMSEEALIDLIGDGDDIREVTQRQQDYFNLLEQQKEDKKLAQISSDQIASSGLQQRPGSPSTPGANVPSAIDPPFISPTAAQDAMRKDTASTDTMSRDPRRPVLGHRRPQYSPVTLLPEAPKRSVDQDEEGSSAGMNKGKDKASILSQSQEILCAPGNGKLLPPRLVGLWTDIDPALPREEIQDIIQATFAEFRLTAPLSAQPWMQVDDKSSVVALEKARITNGGKIPAAWKAVAEESEHGWKWLKIGQEQETAEALTRARDKLAKATGDLDAAQTKVVEAASLYHELNRRSKQAIEHSDAAARDSRKAAREARRVADLAAEAKKAVDKACKETGEAHTAFVDSSNAKDQARIIATDAAAEVKTLEEAETASKSALRGKKRKLGACKSDDD